VKPREPDARYIQLAADGFDPRWSPDGSKIGFLRQSNGILNIWTVRSTGGGEKQVTTEGISFDGFTALPYNRMQTKYFSWSPDSSRIVYCSFKSGQSNLWVASVDGSGEYQVSSNADPNLTFLCPLWSPEGGRIAHVSVASAPSADRRIIESLWVTENERSRIVFQTESILHLIGWSSSGNKVLVALVESGMNSRPKAMQITLAEISIDSGKSRNITKIVSPYFTNIQLSPDGLNIAFVSRQDGKDNIWIVPTDGQAGRKVTENADSAIYISSLAWSPDGKEIYYSKQQGWSIVSTVDNFRSR
jgi:Tol biopolymer transport system component